MQAAYALIRDEDVRQKFDLQMRIGRYGAHSAPVAAGRCASRAAEFEYSGNGVMSHRHDHSRRVQLQGFSLKLKRQARG
jgi:hypothetical protein